MLAAADWGAGWLPQHPVAVALSIAVPVGIIAGMMLKDWLKK